MPTSFNRAKFRDRFADLALRLVKNYGQRTVTFTNPGASPVVLHAMVEKFSHGTDLRNGLTDEVSLRVIIPRQTGFPPAVLRVGATLAIGSTVYEVDQYIPDVEDVAQACTFTFEIGRFGEETLEVDS